MSCPSFETLSAYADREARAAENAALARHLPGCGACRRGLRELKALKRAVAALPIPPCPAFKLPRKSLYARIKEFLGLETVPRMAFADRRRRR